MFDVPPKPPSEVQEFKAVLPSLGQLPLPSEEVAKKSNSRMSALAVERARDRIKQLAKEEGYNEGYENGSAKGMSEGYEKGKTQAYAEYRAKLTSDLEEIKTRFDRTLEQVADAVQAWFKSAEDQYADVAISIAREVLNAELKTNRSSILSIVRVALAEVGHATHARLRANPFDVPALTEHRADILASMASLRDVEFVEDASIVGGVVVETGAGVVDATIDTQLERFETQLHLEEAA